MIDRYQLRYFLAVADQGNFSRAAAQCNVSQPTLSVGIAKLENDLGVQLFIRNSRRTQLTKAGSRLLSYARSIENDFNAAIRMVRGQEPEEAILRLGILRSIPGERIARAMAVMHREAPSALVELVEGTERELVNHLARGRIDWSLTLVAQGGERFVEEPLYEEGYALAVPLDHPAAQAEEVGAELVAEDVMFVRRHCEVLADTSRYFLERGVRPHFAFRSFNDERILQMVASGIGVTVMPQSYQARDVARPRLKEFDHRRVIGLARMPTDPAQEAADHPALAALRHVFRQLAEA